MTTWSREWVGAETRLLAEWLLAKHPTATTYQQQPVGPIDVPPGSPSDSPQYVRMLGRYRRKVDAVVSYPDSTLLVEAAIIPSAGKLGQLLHYAQLFPKTPEFHQLVRRPVALVLLVAQDDAEVEALARQHGCLWEVFSPNWVSAYLIERLPRRNRESG